MTSERENSFKFSRYTNTPKVCEKVLIVDLTLPGFNYLGPGNKLENGPPTNTIDEIAKKHDEAYDQAIDDFKKCHDWKKCASDIRHADEQFLREMETIKPRTTKEALGKAVGLTGIRIKATIERSLGYPLYPSFKITEDKSYQKDTLLFE